ncbi:MAG: eCIS core domain-containing protein [Archangium sp.]
MKSRLPKPASSTPSRRTEPQEQRHLPSQKAGPDSEASAASGGQHPLADIPVSAPHRFGGASTPGGKALPAPVQAKMEQTLGADFSSVRVHTEGEASALKARAFTQGEHVHFSAGEYQPHTRMGQEILGHELAHVVQQRQGRVQANAQMNGLGVNTSSALESEADRLGAKAARGEMAPPSAQGPLSGSSGQAPPVQRKAHHAVQFKCSKQDKNIEDNKQGKNWIPPEEQLENNKRAAEIILKDDKSAHESDLKRVVRVDDNLQAQKKAPSFLPDMSGDAEDMAVSNMADASAQARAEKEALVAKHASALQNLDKMGKDESEDIIHRKNSWQSSSSQQSGSKEDSSCYLTTACVVARGLPDDCEELSTLRHFRDSYLRELPEGPSLIEEYYRVAPAIVQAIRRQADADTLYAHIYSVVTGCVGHIQARQHEQALDAYRRMVLDLKARFLDQPGAGASSMAVNSPHENQSRSQSSTGASVETAPSSLPSAATAASPSV